MPPAIALAVWMEAAYQPWSLARTRRWFFWTLWVTPDPPRIIPCTVIPGVETIHVTRNPGRAPSPGLTVSPAP